MPIKIMTFISVHTCLLLSNFQIHISHSKSSCTCSYLVNVFVSNQNFKDPYLEAEVVEEVIGWLGLVGTATANKFVATP